MTVAVVAPRWGAGEVLSPLTAPAFARSAAHSLSWAAPGRLSYHCHIYTRSGRRLSRDHPIPETSADRSLWYRMAPRRRGWSIHFARRSFAGRL